MSEYRIEPNALAEGSLPTEIYWGVQTERAIEQALITGQKPSPAWVGAWLWSSGRRPKSMPI